MTPTVKEIELWIADIPDPEIPVITIKDLGILRGVDYEDGNYEILITPTYTACPAMQLIETQIKEVLSAKGVHNVKVNLTYSPAWTTDWLTEETKEKLRRYGVAPPRHSSCSKAYGAVQPKTHCPRCNSINTNLISRFGSTACKAYHKCNNCMETFEGFKCH